VTLQSQGDALGDDAGAQEIRALAPWFHNLHLPDGRETAPDHPLGDFPAFKWAQIESALPADLGGLRVLDIGCNAGFYSIALARQGARVLGVDIDEHYLRQACWARERYCLSENQLELRQMHIYELGHLNQSFDIVLFLGVLYHLRYPLLALDMIAQTVGDLLILQTLTMPGEEVAEPPQNLSIDAREQLLAPGWPRMAFIEHSLAGDPTNWWAPNQACVEAMLRAAGLDPEGRPGHEITLARRTSPPRAPAALRVVLGYSEQ
jgi:tRNA (mo5U34)-methyltransferase